MGIETGLMAVGLASQLYQGYQGSKKQKKQEKAAEQQYGMSTDAITKQMGGLDEFLKSLGGPGAFDLGAQPGFNSAQDALMQMLNRSSADQLGSAGGYLDELARTGGAQDVSGLLAALGQQQGFATNEQAARLNASTSGLGQLAGTASRIGEARLRGGMQRDNNVINAGIQSAAMENAANRRLQAAGTLGGLNLDAGQLNLGAAQGLGGLAQLLSQSKLGQSNQLLQGQLGGLNMQNQLLQLLTGNRAPQGSLDSPLAGAVGQTAQDALLIPILLERLKKSQTKPAG